MQGRFYTPSRRDQRDMQMKGAEIMLGENIKNIRKSKGLSQEDLAIRLNVVRQTVRKWETGLSVPDSEMLIKIAEVLETSVSEILGEGVDWWLSHKMKESPETTTEYLLTATGALIKQ